MDLLRKLGIRKSQEYNQVKTNIKYLTLELTAFESKRLNQGEITRFRYRYKRFADKVNKKQFPPKEYMKLHKLLGEFERRFQHTGIIPTQRMANSNEKCCEKHATNEENKIVTKFYGSWESQATGTSKSHFEESGERSTSRQKIETSSQLHYEDETDQMGKKNQQRIKRNDLAQVHSLQHNCNVNQYKSSRNGDINSPVKQSGTDSVYHSDRLAPKPEEQNTKSTQSIENIRNFSHESSSKPSYFPEGRNTQAMTQGTKTEEHFQDLPHHHSTQKCDTGSTKSQQECFRSLFPPKPSSASEERNARTVTPTKMNESIRNLSYLGSPEDKLNEGFIQSSPPHNTSYVPEESSTRAVTPTQSTRTGIEEKIRDSSQHNLSGTSENYSHRTRLTQRKQDFLHSLYSPKPPCISEERNTQERNTQAGTPTQYKKMKDNIGNISHRESSENCDYSRLNDGFGQCSPPCHASYVPEEKNTRAVTPTQNPSTIHQKQEATIRNTNNFQNSSFSQERNTREEWDAKEKSKEETISRRSETPYNTQHKNSEKNDRSKIGTTEFSQSANIYERTREIQEKLNDLNDWLQMHEESEANLENKTNYKSLQKQDIEKGKEAEENMTEDKQDTYITPSSEAYSKRYARQGNIDNLERSVSRSAETPEPPQRIHQCDQHGRRTIGNEFCNTVHEKQVKLGGYSPQTYKACYYQSPSIRNSHGLSDNRLHQNKYIETNLDDVLPPLRETYSEKIINVPQQYDERHRYRGGHQRSRMRGERDSTALEEVKTEVAQEAVEQPSLQILDVHQYFRDDFDINSIDDSLDHESKIKILEGVAKRYDDQVSNFSEEKFSLEYFVLDEKLMRLIEKLDKIKCHDDHEATNKKVQVIEYIKGLHTKLDQRAKED